MGCSHSICITARAGGGGQVGRPMSIGNNGGGSRNLGRNMLRSLKASEGSRFYDIYEVREAMAFPAAFMAGDFGGLSKVQVLQLCYHVCMYVFKKMMQSICRFWLVGSI